MRGAGRRWCRGTAGAVLVLVLLVPVGPPAVGAGDACTDQTTAEVPRTADPEGAAFVVFIDLACAASSEIRVWLGEPDHQASRLWNGSAWASSAFYVPATAFATDREGRLVVPLQAAPDATHGERLVRDASRAGVYLLVRAGDSREGPHPLGQVVWGPTATQGAWVDREVPAVRAVDRDGVLVASAPTGLDDQGLGLPPGFAWLAVPEGEEVALVDGTEPPVAPGDLLLTHVVPHPRADAGEMFRFVERTDALPDLRGLRATDGEGILVFHRGTGSADRAQAHVVSHRGAAAWAPGNFAHWPWYAADDPLPAADGPMLGLPATGHFALANGGDHVSLVYGDVVVDTFAWGSASDAAGWTGEATETADLEGRIFIRTTVDGPPPAFGTVAGLGRTVHDYTDTDGAGDWSQPRIFRAGQTDEAPGRFAADQVRAFTCPDRCLEEVVMRIDAADSSVALWMYDLSLLEAVEPLVDASERGVLVRVFLHGLPIGASDDKQDRIAWAVDTLVAAGADVRMQQRERFDTMHAKTLVVDGRWTVVLSENANLHGWPPDGVHGNRGWGLAVEDTGLARWFGRLFESDFGHPTDSRAVRGADIVPDATPPAWGRVDAPAADRRPTAVFSGPVTVMPVVAPDHLGLPVRSPLVHALEAAEAEILTQQLNLPEDWSRHGWREASPLIGAMRAGAGRGVEVKGVLAGAFDDDDVETPGNDRTAAVLSTVPGIDLRLGPAGEGGHLVHNKGWVVDGAAERGVVFVGSANGNLASQALNREIDLMVEDGRVAAFYRDVLLADHAAARALVATDDPVSSGPDPAPVNALPAPAAPLLVAACLFLFRVRARRD